MVSSDQITVEVDIRSESNDDSDEDVKNDTVAALNVSDGVEGVSSDCEDDCKSALED